jgi:hypothetical protein
MSISSLCAEKLQFRENLLKPELMEISTLQNSNVIVFFISHAVCKKALEIFCIAEIWEIIFRRFWR